MFEYEKIGGLDVIRVKGNRMDASNSAEFLAHVDELTSAGVSRLIVDLSGVSFMDSSALGATVSALKKIGSKGSLTLVGVSGLVDDLFKLTRMDKVFNMVSTLEEAGLAQKTA